VGWYPVKSFRLAYLLTTPDQEVAEEAEAGAAAEDEVMHPEEDADEVNRQKMEQ